jgi:hypothetical protein
MNGGKSFAAKAARVLAAPVPAWIYSVVFFFSAFSVAQASAPPDVLFEQSSLDGVEGKGNYLVPLAEHRPPPTGVFHMIMWQPNPSRSDGMLVPTGWRAGDKTGFYPSDPVDRHQGGFRDAPGSSVLQIDGDTVGAYINSADLPGGSNGYKMMMTPETSVAPEAQVHPFAQSGRAILVSLELQVPTAVDAHHAGSTTYVSADLLFVDRSRGTKISYGCNLFFNGHPHRELGGHVRLDEDSHNMMINSVVGMDNAWLITQPGSAISQSAPWRGWKTFRFAITEKSFIAALSAYNQQAAGVSMNPGDYTFAKFHLNAELNYRTSAAELGWSMRHARVVVEDSALVSQ